MPEPICIRKSSNSEYCYEQAHTDIRYLRKFYIFIGDYLIEVPHHAVIKLSVFQVADLCHLYFLINLSLLKFAIAPPYFAPCR